MSVSLAIAAYIVIWWVVLFAVLPIGVRTQIEDGEVVPGSVRSAPARPHLLKKALLTSAIAAVVLAAIHGAVEWTGFLGWVLNR